LDADRDDPLPPTLLAAGRVADGGTVRHILEAEFVAQLGEVAEELDDARMVGVEEDRECEESEEFVLGEVQAAELAGLSKQGFLSKWQCLLTYGLQ
jgi:hypothetical protein